MTSERTKIVAIERQSETARDWLDCAKHYEKLAIRYAEEGNKVNAKHFEECALKYRLVCCMYALGYLLETLAVVENGEFRNVVSKRKKDD